MNNRGSAGLVKFAVGMWLVTALASLALTVGVVCVALHFVSKFW